MRICIGFIDPEMLPFINYVQNK